LEAESGEAIDKFDSRRRTLFFFKEGDIVQKTAFYVTNHNIFNYTIMLSILI
jgi:hypothetical protein